jgi:predicted DNA-binding transcriptional regulator YafY
MPRRDRLLLLVQLLRRRRHAASAALLASELGKRLRDVYRDIAAAGSETAAAAAQRGEAWLATLRHAMRVEQKVVVRDRNDYGEERERVLWPLAIEDGDDDAQLVVTWCERKNGFESIRLERIVRVELSAERFPRTRRALLREWRRRTE